MKWKIKQYSENGIKFVSLYPWHLNDLEGAFKFEFKKIMGKDLITGPVNEKSVYALPISVDFRPKFDMDVPYKLGLSELQLVYIPYFFVEYDCFTQGKLFYETINLASHGTLVLDGQQGSVIDMILQSGTQPELQQTGYFTGCVGIEQREIPRSRISEAASFSKFDAVPVKITKYDAEKIAKVEIAKNLHETFTHQFRNGSTSSKTLRPYESQVRIVSVKPVNIPLITGVYRYKNRAYTRCIQATTKQIIGDDLIYCNVEERHHGDSIILCEECGSLACKNHGKHCDACDKRLCIEHATSKGLILKKYYCREHVPN